MPKIGDIIKGSEIGKINGQVKRYFIWAACLDCGTERWTERIKGLPRRKRCRRCSPLERIKTHPPMLGRHHSTETRNKIRKSNGLGPNHHAWKGGRYIDSEGYVHVYVSDDDFFSKMGDGHKYVAEHRLIMAKHMKRCLLTWEIVHHKNGIKGDNRLENLELLKCAKAHLPSVAIQQHIKQLEAKIRKLESP